MDELCICGDSFADVTSKSLFTDISGIFFLNFLPIMIRVFLNKHFIGAVPNSSTIYFNNGFNIFDKLTFWTITGQFLGEYIIKDEYLRRISIGKPCYL
jgi:hypothetical protein